MFLKHLSFRSKVFSLLRLFSAQNIFVGLPFQSTALKRQCGENSCFPHTRWQLTGYRVQYTVTVERLSAYLSLLNNLNALSFPFKCKCNPKVVSRSKHLCRIAVSKHGFETAMRGKLLFSPHPLTLICEISRLTPRPKGKNFLKKIFPLWNPFSKNFRVAARLVL